MVGLCKDLLPTVKKPEEICSLQVNHEPSIIYININHQFKPILTARFGLERLDEELAHAALLPAPAVT